MLRGIRTVAAMVAGDSKDSTLCRHGEGYAEGMQTTSSEMLCWSPDGYCRGVMLVSQVAMAVTAARGTASANEQKYRTPVWFGETGEAMI